VSERSTMSDEASPRETQLFQLRPRLVRFFSSRGRAWKADELADDTILRVLLKLRKGESIDNLEAYTLGVARIVLLEELRRRTDDPLPDNIDRPSPESESSSTSDCLDRCLEALPAGARSLILRFYGEGQHGVPNKDVRKRLADDLGMTMNALFIRAGRLRRELEVSVTGCLDDVAARQEAGPGGTSRKEPI
jgi:DNA-directed RNA polymerase specialized sigma24 family protein